MLIHLLFCQVQPWLTVVIHLSHQFYTLTYFKVKRKIKTDAKTELETDGDTADVVVAAGVLTDVGDGVNTGVYNEVFGVITDVVTNVGVEVISDEGIEVLGIGIADVRDVVKDEPEKFVRQNNLNPTLKTRKRTCG